MRNFSYITVGKILDELWEDKKTSGVSESDLFYQDKNGKQKKKLPLTRVTFLRLEKRLGFPKPLRTSGELQWRVYSREQANEIKNKIKTEYNI